MSNKSIQVGIGTRLQIEKQKQQHTLLFFTMILTITENRKHNLKQQQTTANILLNTQLKVEKQQADSKIFAQVHFKIVTTYQHDQVWSFSTMTI